jgi:hypothetical protein
VSLDYWVGVGGVCTWNAVGGVYLEYCGWRTWNTGEPVVCWNTVGGVRTWNAAGGAPLLCGRWESPGCLPWCAPSTCLQGSAQASKGALNVYQCCAHTASITNGTVNYGA